MIVIVAALWGIGVAIFGMANSFILAYVGLAFAGATDAYSALFRQSMWNQSIPPEVRGRMGGIEMISYAIGPMAGQFRAGVMATWTSIRFSLVFGGLAATGSIATVGAALPSLWRFDASTDANVALVKSIREEEAND
jgi:MFS family permease